MPVNVGSITAKFNAAIGSAGFKSKCAGKINGAAIAAQAGADLASAINSAMNGSLSAAELGAVGSASSGGVSDLGNGIYQVGITIPTQFRPSLLPDIYGGVSDMAALFNNGYSAHPLTVIDVSGKIRKSRPFRAPAYFVQNGVAAFGGGSGDYEVISIDISGRFQ